MSDWVWIQQVPTDQDFMLPGRQKGPSESWVYKQIAEGRLFSRDIVGRTYVRRSALKRLIFESIPEQPPAPGPSAQA